MKEKTYQKIFERNEHLLIFEFRIDTWEWALLRVNLINLLFHYGGGWSFTLIDLQILSLSIAAWWDYSPIIKK